MPTDDERREVAARLRDMAPGSDWPNYVAEACGMDVSKMSNNFHTFTEQLCHRLADLIEPEERTCRIEPLSLNEFFAGEKYILSRRARESAKDERFVLLSREIEKDARFMCSNCHVLFGTHEAANADYCILEDGTYEVDAIAPLIKFCPNCGARVVEE